MRRFHTLLAALAIIAAACGGSSTADENSGNTPEPSTTTTTAPSTTSTAPPATTTTTAPTSNTVELADSDLGTILVDGNGNTLYLFTPDNQGDSVCYDECADAWPPLTGDVVAGDGIDTSLLGTASRSDGPDQVTYNGWPLYYFFQDAAPGDTNGQGVNLIWYVLDADGNGVDVAQVLALDDSDLGTILVDGDGNTLYLFTPDNQGDSVCYDECADAWPPLTGVFIAGDGIDEALIGSAPRTDGPDQVTYNGWPLYYFFQDAAPGDANGQGVNDVWFVLDGAGNGIGVDG